MTPINLIPLFGGLFFLFLSMLSKSGTELRYTLI